VLGRSRLGSSLCGGLGFNESLARVLGWLWGSGLSIARVLGGSRLGSSLCGGLDLDESLARVLGGLGGSGLSIALEGNGEVLEATSGLGESWQREGDGVGDRACKSRGREGEDQ
jgi:hypothetical protein